MSSPQPILSVRATIVTPEGEGLIMQRMPGSGRGGMWEIPGGKRDMGESPEEALLREIKEESGLEVEILSSTPVEFERIIPDGPRAGQTLLTLGWCALAQKKEPAMTEHRARLWGPLDRIFRSPDLPLTPESDFILRYFSNNYKKPRFRRAF